MSDTFRHSLLFFLWLLQMRNDISENRFREPFGCQPWLWYLSRSAPSFLPPPAFYAFPNSKICEANYSLLRPLCIIAPKHKKREETRIENGREKNTKLRDRHFCCYVDQTRPAPYSFHFVLFLSFLWWRMFLMWRVWLDSFPYFNPRRRRRNCCLPANVIYNNDVIKI